MPAPDPEEPPDIPIPLIEELRENFRRSCLKDRRLKNYREHLKAVQMHITEIKNSIHFREKLLRKRALQELRERHGIKIIPGYNDPETSYRREIAMIPRGIKKLLDQMGVQLPPERPPDANPPQPDPPSG